MANLGSGALPGLMLYLVLLKISLGIVFSNPVGHYPNPFPAGKANL